MDIFNLFLAVFSFFLSGIKLKNSKSIYTISFLLFMITYFCLPALVFALGFINDYILDFRGEIIINQQSLRINFTFFLLLTIIAQLIFLLLPNKSENFCQNSFSKHKTFAITLVSINLSVIALTLQIYLAGGILDFYFSSHWSDRGDHGTVYNLIGLVRNNFPLISIISCTALLYLKTHQKYCIFIIILAVIILVAGGSGRKNAVIALLPILSLGIRNQGLVKILPFLLTLFIMMQTVLLLRTTNFDLVFLYQEVFSYTFRDFYMNFFYTSEIIEGYMNWVVLFGEFIASGEYDYYISVLRLLGIPYDNLPGNARNVAVYFGDLILPSIDYFTLFPGFILESFSYLGVTGVILNSSIAMLAIRALNQRKLNNIYGFVIFFGFFEIIILQMVRGYLTYVITNFAYFLIFTVIMLSVLNFSVKFFSFSATSKSN